MELLKTLKQIKKELQEFDVTIFQTPQFGDIKGYKVVYRLKMKGNHHNEVLEQVFSKFNTRDLIPNDYTARYITTGDIVFIDEGRVGHFYYQLQSGGWKPVHRFHIR